MKHSVKTNTYTKFKKSKKFFKDANLKDYKKASKRFKWKNAEKERNGIRRK